MRGRSRFGRWRQGGGALLLLLLIVRGDVAAQPSAATIHDFLSQYRGREILLRDKTSDTVRFDDPDSTSRYAVILDEVDGDFFVVHRGPADHRNSYAYSLAAIRRITYLFNGRPYRRILVEAF